MKWIAWAYSTAPYRLSSTVCGAVTTAVRRMRPEIRVPVTTETGSAFMRQAQSLRMVPDNEELNRREERRRQQPLAAVAP